MIDKTTFATLSAAAALALSAAVPAHDVDDEREVGAVYTMTNDPTDNQVVIFSRHDDGTLSRVGAASTHGKGSGGGLDPLGSQGSLTLSRDGVWLFAANAGSDEISVFRVAADGLEFADKARVHGAMPVSVTAFHHLVYVLSAGDAPSITGFLLAHSGRLVPLPGSTRALGAGKFAQVAVDPSGRNLVVTDKANNRILVYSLRDDGLPAAQPVITAAHGNTPFGVAFDRRDHLLVVEAASNAVSSYQIGRNDGLQVISPSVPNGQQAACWIASSGRRYAFTANPGTQTISTYRLDAKTGAVTLLAGAAALGNKPLDLATTENGRFLYALDPGTGSIDSFRIEADGRLSDLGPVAGGFTTFAQGIAVR